MKQVFGWDMTTCCQAAKRGFEELLVYALDRECTTREEGMIAILHNAAKSGDVTMVARLAKRFDYQVHMNDTVMRGGIESGHVAVLDWMRERVESDSTRLMLEWGDGMWRSAAHGGRVDILRWGWQFAKRSDVPMSVSTSVTSWGVLGEHLAVLRWLHEKGFPFGADTWAMGIRGRNESIVSFLLGIRCPMFTHD